MARSNSNEKSIALSDHDLDAAVGGTKAEYYQMNGNWYIVGHDKQGRATGLVKIT